MCSLCSAPKRSWSSSWTHACSRCICRSSCHVDRISHCVMNIPSDLFVSVITALVQDRLRVRRRSERVIFGLRRDRQPLLQDRRVCLGGGRALFCGLKATIMMNNRRHRTGYKPAARSRIPVTIIRVYFGTSLTPPLLMWLYCRGG